LFLRAFLIMTRPAHRATSAKECGSVYAAIINHQSSSERSAKKATQIFAALRLSLVENFPMNRIDANALTASFTDTRVKTVQSEATLPLSLLRTSVLTRTAIIMLISTLLWFAIVWALA
jgi:hypothetical protein